MSSIKNNYVLDSDAETERLDLQARMKAFNFEHELQFLKVKEGAHILDAGCGSGIVSDYLSKLAPGVKVTGCDFSRDRIRGAQKKYGANRNVRFVQKNLLDLSESAQLDSFGGGRFDAIICRYVLRHFSGKDGSTVLRNFYRALKPGGTLYCVDVDGVLGDVYPASPFLRKSLHKLRESKSVNFLIARKLPSLIAEHGFQNVDWRTLISEFRGAELTQEIGNLEKAVSNGASFFTKTLGGAAQFERFQQEYFSALRDQPGKILYYNRVIGIGTKPKSQLKLVG